MKQFAAEEAPSGMLARGTYGVRSRMIDDDATVFLDFEWSTYRLLLLPSYGIDAITLVQASRLPKSGRRVPMT